MYVRRMYQLLLMTVPFVLASCSGRPQNGQFGTITKELDSSFVKTGAARECTEEDKADFPGYFGKSDVGYCIKAMTNGQKLLEEVDRKLGRLKVDEEWVNQGGGRYYKRWRMEPGLLNLSFDNKKNVFIFKFDKTRY